MLFFLVEPGKGRDIAYSYRLAWWLSEFAGIYWNQKMGTSYITSIAWLLQLQTLEFFALYFEYCI